MKNSAIIKILARTINNASQINLMKVFENFGGNFLKLTEILQKKTSRLKMMPKINGEWKYNIREVGDTVKYP